MEIWTEETLALLKVRGVKLIIEISKTGNNGCIKWGVCPYIATYCLEKIVDVPKVAFYFQSGSLPVRNNLSAREFYWSTSLEYYSGL